MLAGPDLYGSQGQLFSVCDAVWKLFMFVGAYGMRLVGNSDMTLMTGNMLQMACDLLPVHDSRAEFRRSTLYCNCVKELQLGRCGPLGPIRESMESSACGYHRLSSDSDNNAGNQWCWKPGWSGGGFGTQTGFWHRGVGQACCCTVTIIPFQDQAYNPISE